ncbi:MAG TPA: YfhO family protein [Candidatus Limnocylindria bacterium]|nr:YfhO family protein [Candidatus Limnocylindria bacterium]
MAAAAWVPLGRGVVGPNDAASAAFDVYAHFLPIMAYAGDAVAAGGRGLWWTALQNCGQPFAAYNGLLYPLHWLPVLLGFDVGLRAAVACNVLLGGCFAYLLGRELGARPAAALVGALVFQLGTTTAHVAAWTPLVLEPYVWFPAALLCVERLLRAPSARDTVLLGGACLFALLPAWPQLVLFLYQLVFLRVVWALVVERPARPFVSLAAVAGGLLLGALLDAVQLLPALAVSRESVRRLTLSDAEITMANVFGFDDFRWHLARGEAYGQPLSAVACVLAATAFAGPRRRAATSFYLLAAVLFLVLAFGPDTPLFQAYLALPWGRIFREPARFVWVTGVCLGVLAALGAEVVAAGGAGRERWRSAALAAAALAGLELLAHGGLRWFELASGAAAVLLIGLWTARPARTPTVALVGALVAAAAMLAPPATLHRWLPSSDPLRTHADLFARLRARTAPAWRAYIVADNPLATRFALMPKTASLFGVPAIADYEPQTEKRFAQFVVALRAGVPMFTLNVFYFPLTGWMAPEFSRPLLDLAAGRFIVVDRDQDRVTSVLRPPPHLVDEDERARVYENPSALPRALWVPRVEVVRRPGELLRRLMVRWVDPWQVALLEAPPASGFLGEPTDAADAATGTATFVRDEPEAVTIDVDAPRRGFLVLADQHRNGWHATVNGEPVPIERANYVFRLVEVPAGRSRVEFRYRPPGLRVGALLSAIALAGSLAVLWLTRRRPAETPAPGGSTR